jgi:manganese oxidase
MNNTFMKKYPLAIALMVMLLALLPAHAMAVVNGITGPTFNLTAKAGNISMGEGLQSYLWGYADGAGPAQYPGPTLIVNQGDTVTINLTNGIPTVPGNLPVNVSILFPGQTVTATGGVAGLLTREAPPGGIVTYTFTASQPGTYTYYSGTQPELQVEMGLFGAIVVRPTLTGTCPLPADPNGIRPSRGYAYCNADAYFDREYLFVLSEIDPAIHLLVGSGQMAKVNNTARRPTAWFQNGRNFPDTMVAPFDPSLPNQPYDSAPVMHPGEKVLIRLVGGGRNLHPFHTHGQNHLVIARDGRMLKTGASAIIDLQLSDFTTTSAAGETVDAIWGPWTGAELGWDVYGHNGTEPGICVTQDANGFDTATGEYCPDHGKPIPVVIPAQSLFAAGPMYGGTPYLGVPGDLPPVHVQYNPMGAYSFMWHSHSERELTTNNIFLGGMATMAMVIPYFDMDGNPILIP